MAGKSLQQELGKKKPFESPEKEAMLNIARASDQFQNTFGKLFRSFGLTGSQHNVLRILRGAGDEGLPTLAIRDRMIDEGSTVTRLLDKLEQAGFVTRDRSRPDRRQVLCRITAQGEALLAQLDPTMDSADTEAMAVLNEASMAQLIELLASVRMGNQ